MFQMKKKLEFHSLSRTFASSNFLQDPFQPLIGSQLSHRTIFLFWWELKITSVTCNCKIKHNFNNFCCFDDISMLVKFASPGNLLRTSRCSVFVWRVVSLLSNYNVYQTLQDPLHKTSVLLSLIYVYKLQRIRTSM